MIEAARKKSKNDTHNAYHFSIGDGLQLPFEDMSFDLVVSYTFLSSIHRVPAALAEMHRVLRPGGRVGSCTPECYIDSAQFAGHWPKEMCDDIRELLSLENKVQKMVWDILHIQENLPRIEQIPCHFGLSQLENIEMHSIGIGFSLSNQALPLQLKQEYIESIYQGKKKQFERFWKMPIVKQRISEQEAQRYIELLKTRHDFLLANMMENTIWNWAGGAMLLMTGTRSY